MRVCRIGHHVSYDNQAKPVFVSSVMDKHHIMLKLCSSNVDDSVV